MAIATPTIAPGPDQNFRAGAADQNEDPGPWLAALPLLLLFLAFAFSIRDPRRALVEGIHRRGPRRGHLTRLGLDMTL